MLKLSNIFFIFTIYTAYGIVLIDGFESKYTSPSPLYAIGSPTPNNKRFVQIYIPDHYFDSEDEYPVIYFLHGFGQNYSSYYTLLTLVDELIKQEKIPPVIVVKPDAMVLGYLGSFYTNSELGKFQNYIKHELIRYIEQKYRVKKTSLNRALIGYGMGACGALLHAFSIPCLFGSISCHLTQCSLACPVILEHNTQLFTIEQDNNKLFLPTFNSINGPASFLFEAFETSQYSTLLKEYVDAMPLNNSIDQLIIECAGNNLLLNKGACQIQEMTQKKYINSTLLKTCIHDNSPLKKENSFNSIPLCILWPVIKNAIKILPDIIQCNGFTMQTNAIIALLSVGIDPFDYINHNNHFLLSAEQSDIKAETVFRDIPSAAARLMVDPQQFSIEPDYDEIRFKEALIMHGSYFLNC